MRRRVERLKAQGFARRRARAHPCADRARHRRGVAGRDRGRDHGRDHRAAAADAEKARSSDEIRRRCRSREAEGAIAVHSIRKGGLVLKKGTADRQGRDRGARGRRHRRDRGGAARAGRRVGGRGRGRDRGGGRGRGRARRPRLHRARQSVCRERRRAGGRQGRRSIALNQVDEAITFATLPAFKPVVAGEMIATVKIIPFAVAGEARDARARGRARRRAADPRRAVSRSARSASSRPCCRGSPTR